MSSVSPAPSAVSTPTNASSSNAKSIPVHNVTSPKNDHDKTANVKSKPEPSEGRTTNGSLSDTHTSTEGHRTPNFEKLSKTNLYIRGLAANTSDEVLYNMCARFGNISSTKAILDKITGSCRGYGFVQFSDARSAEVAVQELTRSGVQAQMARVSPTYLSHNQHHSHHNHHFHHNHYHSNHHNNGDTHHHRNPNVGNNHGSGTYSGRSISGGHIHNHGSNNIHQNNSDPDPTNLYLKNLPTNMTEQELENLLSNYGPVVSTRILRDGDNRPKGVGFARMESKDKCQEIIDNLNGKSYKGSGETLLVKFADGGIKKRNQHNNHHHNNNHLHQQHIKVHQDEVRWRENINTSGDNGNVSGFEYQSNIPHSNQMSDLAMIGALGYHRLQPAFPSNVAPGSAYTAALGPSTSGPQWVHHPGSGQPWNLIPQQMIPTTGLAPSNQPASAAFPFGPISQLASQMQGLHLSHHHGAPMPADNMFPPPQQWAGMWQHSMPPHQVNQMRMTTQLSHPPQVLQPAQDQDRLVQATVTASTATSDSSQMTLMSQQKPSNETVATSESKTQVPSPL